MRVAFHNSTFTRASAVPANRRGVVRTRMIRKPSAARWPACLGLMPSHPRVDSALTSGEIANTASVGGGETDTARDKASRCNGGEPKTRNRAGGAGANRPSILAANHGISDKAIDSPDIDVRSYVGRDLRFSISNERIRQ